MTPRPAGPVGAPLGPPRFCPACSDAHPVGTTCAGGWAPWRSAVDWSFLDDAPPMVVELTAADQRAAGLCAGSMVRHSAKHGLRDRHGRANEATLANHTTGALGEIAFARFMGLEWRCHPGTFGRPDVGRYEVRSTTRGDRIYTKASDQAPRIVAVRIRRDGARAWAEIAGWMTPADIRNHGRPEPHGEWAVYGSAHLTRTFEDRLA